MSTCAATKYSTPIVSARPTSAKTTSSRRTDRCKTDPPVRATGHERAASARDRQGERRGTMAERREDDAEPADRRDDAHPAAVEEAAAHQGGVQLPEAPDAIPAADCEPACPGHAAEVPRERELDEEAGHDREEEEAVDHEVVRERRPSSLPSLKALEHGLVMQVERQKSDVRDGEQRGDAGAEEEQTPTRAFGRERDQSQAACTRPGRTSEDPTCS